MFKRSAPNQALDAESAFHYAESLKTSFPEGEFVIATNAKYAFCYAWQILHKRFVLGESAIAQDAFYACQYARYILQGRFSEGEPAIAMNGDWSIMYAEILGGRFVQGEVAISQSPQAEALYVWLCFPNTPFVCRHQVGEYLWHKHGCVGMYAESVLFERKCSVLDLALN